MLMRIRAFFSKHPNAIGYSSVAFAIVMLGLVMVVLVQAREDATTRARENAENLARVLEHDVTYTAELTDLSVRAAVDSAQDADIMKLPPRYRQDILIDRAATAGRYIGSLLYLDANGNIVVDSASVIPRGVNLGDRDWFTVQRDHPHEGLYISRPLQSRLNRGQVEIMFSRRVNHPDGEFAGVVVGAFRVDYFKNLLAEINLGPHGEISLLQADGQVVARYPDDQAPFGENVSGRPTFERFNTGHESAFFATSTRDGEDRLYCFRRFDKLKMIVVVAPSSRYIFADWTTRAWYIGVLAFLLVAGALSSAWLLSFELRHRLTVEANLRTLTQIDGLTGLSNRRTLDDCLMLEWRRAARTGKPLSVLFVDIDRFKNYNDAYGHQAGDDALIAVAQAIARCASRPSDLTARFGGEEFLVVLPETDTRGASAVAAAIHAAVDVLAIPHAVSELGTVTVSIGLASTDSADAADAQALVKLADEAVYQAKAMGRNRTCQAQRAGDHAEAT
jgi:diguanylate cyclase (GGDEF)-like protein